MIFRFKNSAMMVLSLSWCAFVAAQETRCDQLAASPKDGEKIVAGISYMEINPRLAIPACKEAVEKNPEISRLWFQYGRALEKNHQFSDAIAAYKEAEKLNHAAAINNIGELQRDGLGFPKDVKKAEQYFSKSAKLGSTEGRDNLNKLMNVLKSNTIQAQKADVLKSKQEHLKTQALATPENLAANMMPFKDFNDVVVAAASLIDKSPGFLDVYVNKTNPNDVIICSLLGIWMAPTIIANPNKFPESFVKIHALNNAAATKAYKEIVNNGKIQPDYLMTFGRHYASLPQTTLVKDYFPMCDGLLSVALKSTNPEYYSDYKNRLYTP